MDERLQDNCTCSPIKALFLYLENCNFPLIPAMPRTVRILRAHS